MGLGHWIIVAIIVMFFLSRVNTASIGRNIGRGIKGFKEGLNDIDGESRQVEDVSEKKDQGKS